MRRPSTSACARAGSTEATQAHAAAVDAPVFLQHRDPLGLGRVRGDDRADAQRGQQALDLLGVDAGSAAAESTCAKVPRSCSCPRRLDMAAPAHRGVLLGDAEKLEPDALHLQRPGHQFGREPGDVGAALQHRRDLGLMLANHVEQQRKQQVGGFLRVRASDQRRRRLGL